MEPVAGSSSTPRERPRFMKRTLHKIADLNIKRSIGAISSTEYKRLTTLNELSSIAFSADKTSLSTLDINEVPNDIFNIFNVFNMTDDILCMEVDPRESKYLLTISKCNYVSLYNISDNVQIFDEIMRMNIPHGANDFKGPPNSSHWLYDSNVFTVCTLDFIQFWDSRYCRIIETIPLYSKVFNHVVAAKTSIHNKHVAVTGAEGHVFLIDMLRGTVVLTIPSVEKSSARAICWNPNHELEYITGNNNGNIYLWDVRFHKNCVRKFNINSFSKLNSHSNPVIGLRFYNYGNSVVSVDSEGIIKTWQANNGENYGNYYELVALPDKFKRSTAKCYHFDATVNLKQDIVFLPTKKGLRMFDINTGEHLPNSNDVSLPLDCVTYDPNRFRVFGGSKDLVKLWTPEQKNRV